MTPTLVLTLLIAFLLGAATFALAYSAIVTQLSRGLISSYTKADVRKRLNAAGCDGLVVATLCCFYWTTGSLSCLAAGAGYLLLRDAIGGQSLGKVLFGLVVIDLQAQRAASVSASVKRNLLLLLPGANMIAIFLEARTIVADPQGQRLGDKLAQTQVVEGAGVRELVKSFQDWVRGGRALAHRRPRAAGRIDRAA